MVALRKFKTLVDLLTYFKDDQVCRDYLFGLDHSSNTTKQTHMKTITSFEIPEQLEGFKGGMGFKSIQSITESDLGFDLNIDVKGYISEEVNGEYYAEVMDSDGNAEYAKGSIDEMQKWITDKVHEYCTEN